jgi:threonine synthase
VRYVSTRGGVPAASFEEVLLAGIAGDGGLYVPEAWPELSSDQVVDLARRPYPEVVAAVGELFGAGDIGELVRVAVDAYAGFEQLVPLTTFGESRYLLELFWGPTFAFKDYALQWLGRLLDRTLRHRGDHYLVLGATSGDTGSAAIAALAGLSSLNLVVLHPHDRISEVQRRQMTTVMADNVHNLAIDGTFDDCQRIVKELLVGLDRPVSSVNSINWVRILGQIPYYLWAVGALGSEEVDVVVPTGNFGNVYSAWAARRIGAPIRKLIVGTNVNRSVVRFFEDGRVVPSSVIPTITPAMDIQIPSNLERLVFEVVHRDGKRVVEAMSGERVDDVDGFPFEAYWFTDDQIRDTMRDTYRAFGVQVDPHTAVAIAASDSNHGDVPSIVVGTAHPAKFPSVVTEVTGRAPDTPTRIAQLADRDERFVVLPSNREVVERFITWKIGGNAVQ